MENSILSYWKMQRNYYKCTTGHSRSLEAQHLDSLERAVVSEPFIDFCFLFDFYMCKENKYNILWDNKFAVVLYSGLVSLRKNQTIHTYILFSRIVPQQCMIILVWSRLVGLSTDWLVCLLWYACLALGELWRRKYLSTCSVRFQIFAV